MTFYAFLGEYWLGVSGIISFIFMCGYTYSSFKQVRTDREADRKENEEKLKEQKKDHDEKITVLFERLAKAEGRVDAVKTETTQAIQTIQLDIREIMTILKRQTA